jgi:hypothetical protein
VIRQAGPKRVKRNPQVARVDSDTRQCAAGSKDSQGVLKSVLNTQRLDRNIDSPAPGRLANVFVAPNR